MRRARTYRWTRMRPYRARFRGQGVFFAFQSWAGCITNIFGFDLRQAQPGPGRAAPPICSDLIYRQAQVALWSWNVDTDAITMDEPAYDLWEVFKDEQKITFEILSKNIHPADLERVRSAFAATRAVVGSYEIDFRILTGSDIRWISARGQGDDADIADRTMFGIFLDVTQRKQAEEANELLAGEVSHRVMNLLQIATALTQITSRSAATKEDMAQDLISRLIALGRAQDLVRPMPGRTSNATLLGDLISILLAPYDEKGASVRVRVAVPKMNVGERSSTTLA